MPIRPNGFTADLLRKEITAAYGRRWFTRSDCVELLESLYKDGVTGYMYSTFIGKGYQLVRALIDRGEIVEINKVELCLSGNEDYWLNQPTVLSQYGEQLERIVQDHRPRAEFSIADLLARWDEPELTNRAKAVAFRKVIARHLRTRTIITEDNGRTFMRVR